MEVVLVGNWIEGGNTMRYKVGDIVVIGYKNSRQPITVEVRGVNDDGYILGDGGDGIKKLYLCPEEMIDHEATERLDIDLVSEKNKEIAQMFTKDDLETRMVAELSNGERMLIVGEVLMGTELDVIKMTNEINDENIDKIKKSTQICKDSVVCCSDNCEICVKSYLKTLLNKVKN